MNLTKERLDYFSGEIDKRLRGEPSALDPKPEDPNKIDPQYFYARPLTKDPKILRDIENSYLLGETEAPLGSKHWHLTISKGAEQLAETTKKDRLDVYYEAKSLFYLGTKYGVSAKQARVLLREDKKRLLGDENATNEEYAKALQAKLIREYPERYERLREGADRKNLILFSTGAILSIAVLAISILLIIKYSSAIKPILYYLPAGIILIFGTAGFIFDWNIAGDFYLFNEIEIPGFYMLLRVVVCPTFAWLVYRRWPARKEAPALVFTLIAFAILYNPIFPVRLGEDAESVWAILNLITLCLLIWGIFAKTIPSNSSK